MERLELHMVREPVAATSLSGRFAQTSVRLDTVDWSQDVALVLDMGERRTGGYSVTVTKVEHVAPDQVVVRVTLRSPTTGDFVMQAITHPHAVARLPKGALSGGDLTVTVRDQHDVEVARQVFGP